MSYFGSKGKLQYRVTLLIFGILLVIGVIGSAIMLHLQRQATLSQFNESALTLAETLEDSLEHAMLEANRNHIQEAISRSASGDLINEVVILSNTQEVYASGESSEIGKTRNDEELAQALSLGKTITRTETRYGLNEICVILPIENKPECYSCHSPEVNILGAIEIGLDREPLDRQINENILVMGLIGGLTFLAIGVALAFTLRVTVVKPMSKFIADAASEREEQEKLYLTDRLASIGELASGVAHELNNPLTSIIGFSQLLLDKDIADDIKKDLEVVHSEAQRAAGVVRNLLTFARKHSPAKQLVNINNIIDKVLQLRAYEQRVNNIQVITRFAPDLPEVMADYFQLEQVFFNIIINAEHFMTEAHGRGSLTITTEKAGGFIRASFADNGPGIPKENLGRLFDPFFTTKQVGKGTGLGLSICHGIITEHGGRIYAESKLGKGATFVVELPIAGDDKEGVER